MQKKNNPQKARSYKPSTIKQLFALAGNECAYPSCSSPVIGEDGGTIIGTISHIEAASPEGPRFNPDMSDDDRRSFANLMILCHEHHKIIDSKDNEKKFSVLLLKAWKKDHEAKNLHNTTQKHPMIFTEIINSILKIPIDGKQEDFKRKDQYGISAKVSYNRIVRYKPFIDEYKVYHGKLEKIYCEMDKYGDGRKRLFRIIKHIYLGVRGDYVKKNGSVNQLLDKSDEVMDKVKEVIEGKIAQGFSGRPFYEDIDVAITILMVDAFINCKILEEPPKDYVSR